jgi:hypothetical protein
MATKQSGSTKKAEPKTKNEARPEPEVKREVPIVLNAKMANPESILEKYDDLINKLAEVEAQQRLKNKPYRIYFVHRKRMEVMKMNFIKSLR